MDVLNLIYRRDRCKLADKKNSYPDNVEGNFYVDDSCIACGVCPDEAPGSFTMSDDGSHAYVYSQPEDETEIKACEEALDSCPVDAIGSDG